MKLDSIPAPDSFEDAVLSRSLITGLPTATAPANFEESVLQSAKTPAVQPSKPHITARRPFWQTAVFSTAAVGTIIGTLSLWSTSNPSKQSVTPVQQQVVRAAVVQTVKATSIQPPAKRISPSRLNKGKVKVSSYPDVTPGDPKLPPPVLPSK